MLEWIEDLEGDLFLHRLHAADILKRDLRSLYLGIELIVTCLPRFADSTFHHFAVIQPIPNPQFPTELFVGCVRIGFEGQFVLCHRATDVPFDEQQFGVEHIGGGRCVLASTDIFGDHHRLTRLPLLAIDPGQIYLDVDVVRSQCQCFAKLLLRLVESSEPSQGCGQMNAQRYVVG